MSPTSLFMSALIGYEPIVDRQRNALAMRVSVSPGEPEVNMAALYREFTEQRAGEGGTIALRSSAPIDEELLSIEPSPTLWIEVPGAMMDADEGRALAAKLHEAGFALMLGGRPERPLTPDLVPAFRMSIIHVDADRRLQQPLLQALQAQAQTKRSIPHVNDGVRTIAMMEKCFERGAVAVVGWPTEDALQHVGRENGNPNYATIVDMMSMIDRNEDPVAMEKVIRRDAALAYKLLRYINSPGFGLSVEVQSFRHAVMMLGYGRLKRWCALLLATACKDSNLRPAMVASFRRGVFLEHLIGAGQDEQLRDEVFILGVLSLLDKLLKRPFQELFRNLHVPERVHETLVDRRGPYMPYLKVVESIENGPDPQLPSRLDDCVMSLGQCNQAVLRALTAPDLISA
ncbi:MAG: histidine kinase [Burkholderiales bacterium]|jgi:EAL and modified HD-GYP domain-containing signal transduction protein|nr:MAG: histidine kinase [Burkholderiales bacterium]